MSDLANAINNVNFYSVDAIGSSPAKNYIGEDTLKRGNIDLEITIADFFQGLGPTSARTWIGPIPKPGIYSRAGETVFKDKPLFLLHELMHVVLGVPESDLNLDEWLLLQLGIAPMKKPDGTLESASEAASRYFNSGCESK